jgi:hypothetical protein
MKNENITKLTFDHWLGAEAICFAYKANATEIKRVAISREMLIKRVANSLDASHVSGESNDASENKFDEPIHKLLSYLVCGLPLPYIMLLKIAQDILEVADRHSLP